MKKCLQSILLLLCILCASIPVAQAEDSFTIDIDILDMGQFNSDDYVARELSASAQGIRVVKYISDSSELAAPIRLTLKRMDTGAVLFDKDYGYQSHTFDSGIIYLHDAGDHTTPYLVMLIVGNYTYAMPFMHLQCEAVQSEAQEAEQADAWENEGWDDSGWDDDDWDNGGWEDESDDSGWEDDWFSDASGWE